MDDIDRTIIGVMVGEGRVSISSLAERVGLSASATSERVRRLEREGVIAGFRAEIDPKAIGRTVDTLIDIQVAPGSSFGLLDGDLAAMPEVVDAVHVTGPWDYQVRARCRSIDDLEILIRRLKEDLGVRETSTRVVLRTVEGFPRQPIP